MPEMNPLTSLVKRTPSSTAPESTKLITRGTTTVGSHRLVHGQLLAATVTVMLLMAVWMLPLSSVARLWISAGPMADGIQSNVQFDCPCAGRQVAPPSNETSTPATAPPVSNAVPRSVSRVPTRAAAVGAVTDEDGGVVSSLATAGCSPGCSEPALTPMSASRFTVAWRMRGSGVELPDVWFPSRPQLHCTVPAPKTSADLGCPCASMVFRR